MLLAAGANADVPRNDGATPLWIASQMGCDHVVKVLLQNGAYVDAVRNDGATPLFKASHKGHHAVVHELLKHRPALGVLPVRPIYLKLCSTLFNSNFNIQNGETPLHAAALFGHLPIVKQLIAAGSDLMLKNQDGLSAIQVAKQQKYIYVVEYLLEKEREISLLCKGIAQLPRAPMNNVCNKTVS